MSTQKVQKDTNAIHHKAPCRMLVEAVSQITVNIRRVKGYLREEDAMMKAMTQSHVAL